jgi:kinesin family protein 4/21/27
MGTAYNDNSGIGLIPQVMNALFNKIETLKHQTEFQLHVSFIEVFVNRYAQYYQIFKDAAFF